MVSWKYYFCLALCGLFLFIYLTSLKRTHGDFDVYYEAGQNFISKKQIYIPKGGIEEYKYAPFFALIISPLTFFERLTALYIWNILQFCFLSISLILLLNLSQLSLDRKKTFLLFILTLMGCFRFMITNIKIGQSNLLILMLLISTFYFVFHKKNEVLSAGTLAFSLTLKFFPLLWIAYFLIKKKFRLILYTLCFLSVFLILPAFYTGWDLYQTQLTDWMNLLRNNPKVLYYTPKNNSFFAFYAWLLITRLENIPMTEYLHISTPLNLKIYMYWFFTGVLFFILFFFREFLKQKIMTRAEVLMDLAGLFLLSLMFNPLAHKDFFIFTCVPYFTFFYILLFSNISLRARRIATVCIVISFMLLTIFKSAFLGPKDLFYFLQFKPLLWGSVLMFCVFIYFKHQKRLISS